MDSVVSPFPDQTVDMRTISEIIRRCLDAYDAAYLVIDALDEFSEEDLGWMPLLQEIQAHLGRAKILITSRPIASIEQAFADAPKVRVSAQPADIVSYIRMSLDQPVFAKHLRGDESLRRHIENNLAEKSQGM
jgi:hypothetical protein